ncbi:MAG: hypothetical protein Q9191_004078 [Dirinaria sp. TL-2023a]
MAANPSTDELLTEHFRYTPLSLIDDIINAVNTIIYRAIEAIETGLLNLPPAQLGFTAPTTSLNVAQNAKARKKAEEELKDRMQAEIENGCHQLETLLVDSADKTFDKFEVYVLRAILTVEEGLGEWIRLSHYENLQLPPPANAPTPESILLLRRKLQETRKLNVALRRQHWRNETLISQVQNLSTPLQPSAAADQPNLSFLTSNAGSKTFGLSFSPQEQGAEGPLTTHARFGISQLPALRAHLAALRPKLQTLPEALDSVDWEGRREERRAYVEGRVRRIVEKGGGSSGEELERVVDREGRVGREEVEGLERIVRSL